MTPAGEVSTIGRTHAFYDALARCCEADVQQIELALADLAALELDEATLDGFQSAQDDARRAAGRCRSTIAVLDARQALLEEAVNATPDAARIEFYQQAPTTAKGSAVTSSPPATTPQDEPAEDEDEVYHEPWCADRGHAEDEDCPMPHMSWCTERDHDTTTEECTTSRVVPGGIQLDLTGIYGDNVAMTVISDGDELSLDEVDAVLAALQEMRATMATSIDTEVHNIAL